MKYLVKSNFSCLGKSHSGFIKGQEITHEEAKEIGDEQLSILSQKGCLEVVDSDGSEPSKVEKEKWESKKEPELIEKPAKKKKK